MKAVTDHVRLKSAVLLLSLGNGGVSGIAIADATAERAGVAELQDVVVTAQKRAESLQDVPISIAALAGEELNERGLQNPLDLQYQTPGLVISSSSGQAQIYIRGVGTDIASVGVEQSVAVYIDGVYQGRSEGGLPQFVDVERVEVLKGPQGTLYGRNATGGAINIVSMPPSNELSGSVDVLMGNYDQFTARGTVSGPIVKDRIMGRVSFIRNRNDGTTRELLLDRRGDSYSNTGVRGALLFQVTDDVDLTVNAAFMEMKDYPILKPLDPATNPVINNFGAEVIDDPRTVKQDGAYGTFLDRTTLDATLNWNFGAFSVKSTTAYQRLDWKLPENDVDATEIAWVTTGNTRKIDFFSEDVVLTSLTDSNLSWIMLLSYSKEWADQSSVVRLPTLGVELPTIAKATGEAFAIAGEASYRIMDNLKLTAGLRYTDESKEITRAASTSLAGAVTDDASWSELTPSFRVEYSVGDALLYASATKGFKSGGYNSDPAQEAFDPETIWGYEVGLKSTWLDNRLRFNASAFYYDYKNLQVNRFEPPQVQFRVENAGAAKVKGIDVEVLALPTDHLRLEANLAVLNARYKKYSSVNPDSPANGVIDLAGNAMTRAPDFTANLAAEYSWPVADAGTLVLRGEYFYRDRIYFTPFNEARVGQKSIELLNARVTFRSPDDRWYVAAYGKNLTDVDHVHFIASVQGLIGQVGLYSPPRTYGIQAGWNF